MQKYFSCLQALNTLQPLLFRLDGANDRLRKISLNAALVGVLALASGQVEVAFGAPVLT